MSARSLSNCVFDFAVQGRAPTLNASVLKQRRLCVPGCGKFPSSVPVSGASLSYGSGNLPPTFADGPLAPL